MDFYNRYFGNTVTIWGRATIGTSKLNVYELAQALDWGTVFDTEYLLDFSSSSANDAAAGTGARTINVYGLDLAGNPLVETVTLNGQTKATSSKKFWRVFGAKIATAGTGRTNAGDVYFVKTGTGGAHTGGVPTLTSGVLKMLIGEGTASSGMYTAPRGTVYRLDRLILNDRVQVGKWEIAHAAERVVPVDLPHACLTLDTPVSQSSDLVLPPFLVLNQLEDMIVKATMGAASGVVAFIASLQKV